jgi:predicted nuclease of predicted toxin-antitoxin system
MKLLFDESLSPKLVDLLCDLSRNPKVRSEMGWHVAAISEFWSMPAQADLSWSRPTAISNVF